MSPPSPPNHLRGCWSFLLLFLFTANLLVLGALAWLWISDLRFVTQERANASQTTPLPVTSTLPPDATPDTRQPLALVPVVFSPTPSATLMSPVTATIPNSPTSVATSPPIDSPTALPTIPLSSPTVNILTEEALNSEDVISSDSELQVSIEPMGILLRWSVHEGERYQLYSNLGRGISLYRLLGETDEGQWLDTTVQAGRTYQYQLVIIREEREEAPIGVRVMMPDWPWQTAGWPNREGQIINEPSALASPTTTPAPLALTVTERSSYRDSLGRWHVFALLRNDHDVGLVGVTALVNRYDSNQRLFETMSGQPYTQLIPSGNTIPLHLTTTGNEPASYEIIAAGIPGIVEPLPLTVEASQATQINDTRYEVKGRIRNTGEQRLDFPRVAIVLIDDTNRPINIDVVRPIPAQIEADGTAIFEIRFDYFPRVVGHEVYVLP